MVSPLLYGDYLYLLSASGILTCVDAKSGDVKYDNGRVPVPAAFIASPVAFGGMILLTSEDGDTFVVKAGPQHAVLAYQRPGRGRVCLAGVVQRPPLHPRRAPSLLHQGSELRLPLAQGIPGQWLDFDDLRAPIGHRRAGESAGDQLTKFQYAKAVKWSKGIRLEFPILSLHPELRQRCVAPNV